VDAERKRLIAENNRLRRELRQRYDLSNIVNSSRAMRLVCEQIGKIAHSSADVLLRGEPGTGKTLIARTIHHNSPRARRPFVKMSCAGVSDTSLDVHLLGDATTARGFIQRITGGTVFLDEVGGLDWPAQNRLLQLIQSRDIEPVDRSFVRLNLRIIAATSQSLDDAVARVTFKEELHQHLSAVTIVIPPLRERKADLPVLVDLLVERFSREHERRVSGVSARAMDMLASYAWPGNVRELTAVIERAVVLASGPVIHHRALPTAIQDASRDPSAVAPVGLTEAIDAYEEELLRDALKQTRGVRSRAARLLRTTERIFRYKLRKHGIDSRQFKVPG
jgi:Nif-specific regulatory protein